MSWIETTKQTMFQHSIEKSNIAKALCEWEYRGNMYDTEENVCNCELCNHPDLRYQFEIVNTINNRSLLVGSECIKKFDGIAVLDDGGRVLNTISARKKIDTDKRTLITNAKIKHVINRLLMLGVKDESFDIESNLQRFKKRGAFSPDELNFIFWRFKEHNISFMKAYFKISIMKKKEKNQLLNMKDWKLKNIYKSLSSSQKTWLETNRMVD